MADTDNSFENLPNCANEYIDLIIKKMRYRRKVRDEVRRELAAHFTDALKDCQTSEEKELKAEELIDEFGDARVLAKLIRRGKKRCRPLWRKVVARTFQAAGLLILFMIIYTGWFLSGKPNITTDYIAEFNRIVRPVADESLNAAPFYQRGAELTVESPKDLPIPSRKTLKELDLEEQKKIHAWVSSNQQALSQIVLGNKKPYYWQKYSSESDELLNVLLPHLSKFKKLAYAFCWRAQLNAQDGRYIDAFEDIKSCYSLGSHLKGDKTLIEQLVGIAIESVVIGTLELIVANPDIDSKMLAALQEDFEEMIANEDFTMGIKGEKLLIYDEIQRCFTDDRVGGGHLYVKRLLELIELCSDSTEQGFWENVALGGRALFTQPYRQQTMETTDKLFDYIEKVSVKSPALRRAEGIDIGEEAGRIVRGNMLLEMLVPAMNRISILCHQNRAGVEATLAIIATLRYKADTGDYPEQLQDLVDNGYLKELPLDPYSDKPLVYKKTDSDFTLYSIGPNFTDDGGKAVKKKGRKSPWLEDGDTVFWPVE